MDLWFYFIENPAVLPLLWKYLIFWNYLLNLENFVWFILNSLLNFEHFVFVSTKSDFSVISYEFLKFIVLTKDYCTVWFFWLILIGKWIYFILKFSQFKPNILWYMWALEFLNSEFFRISYKFSNFLVIVSGKLNGSDFKSPIYIYFPYKIMADLL